MLPGCGLQAGNAEKIRLISYFISSHFCYPVIYYKLVWQRRLKR